VKTCVEPGKEPLLVIFELDTCYAECVESERPGFISECTLDGGEVYFP
jgi:hypothetical protein